MKSYSKPRKLRRHLLRDFANMATACGLTVYAKGDEYWRDANGVPVHTPVTKFKAYCTCGSCKRRLTP